jgi:hypothetical protein
LSYGWREEPADPDALFVMRLLHPVLFLGIRLAFHVHQGTSFVLFVSFFERDDRSTADGDTSPLVEQAFEPYVCGARPLASGVLSLYAQLK